MGTAVIFDTGQPHAVILRRDSDRTVSSFSVTDFPPERDCTHVFLTWELPIEHVHVAQALQIAFDIDTASALQMDGEQLWRNGEPVTVCPNSGQFIRKLS